MPNPGPQIRRVFQRKKPEAVIKTLANHATAANDCLEPKLTNAAMRTYIRTSVIADAQFEQSVPQRRDIPNLPIL